MENVMYTEMDDQELLVEIDRLARDLSYYNAAEGSWIKETEARNACRKEFHACLAEMKIRGIEFVNKGYLI